MLYKKGWYLALVGEADDQDDSDSEKLTIWYAVCRQNVSSKTSQCHVEWLENIGIGEFKKSGILDKVPVDSILGRISLKEKEGTGETPNKKLLLSKKSSRQSGQWFQEKTGINLPSYDSDTDTEEEKVTVVVGKKRKRDGTTSSRSKKVTKAPKKKKVKVKKEKVKKQRIKKEKKVKEPKAKKPKVDKSNPNWRLKPNLTIQVYDKDPLFETNVDVPFVSSSAHSKLIIRAVILRNHKLLKKHIEDTKKICSINMNRSMACEMNGFKYAVMNEDIESAKVLLKAQGDTKLRKRCSPEACLLPVHGTGKYNYRSLGIRHIRRVNLSRGSREGNNAFTKDRNNMEGSTHLDVQEMMGRNLSKKFIDTMKTLTKIPEYQFIENVYAAMRSGNVEIAAEYIAKDMKHGSEQFSKFFLDALTKKGDPWDGKVREASARKKAHDNRNVTTLHAACINSDTGPLQALLQVCPDMYLSDDDGWKLVHYAAVAKSSKALEVLLERGVPSEDPEKNGLTPLALACKTGRFKNADVLLKHNAQNDMDEDSIMFKKYGRGQVNKAGKDSWAPIHQAVANSHIEVAKVLVNYSVDANKPLNTKYDKMTPLMLAAANGDLDMVKYLVKYAKIQKPDRYKRTALTHAVINGNAHVASYLISLGADVNGVDSSGNSNLHYACAYGWWFCMKLLLDAGADPNAANEWKLTPLSAAILKGNTGLGKFLSTLPGVDLEVKDDKGRTILLNMLIDNEEGLTNAKLEEIKSFVIDYKADPHCSDNEGKTALHYIAEIKSQHGEDMTIFHRNIQSLLNFFLDQNVSPIKIDKNGKTPIQVALNNKYEYDGNKTKPSFEVISILLQGMQKSAKSGEHLSIVSGQVLMKDFFNAIDLRYMKNHNKEIYSTIMDIMRIINNGDLTFLDEICSTGEGESNINWTVFSELCKSYASTRKDNYLKDDEDQWQSYLEIFCSFHDAVKPRHSFAINTKTMFHCLLTLCSAKDQLQAVQHLFKTIVMDVNVVSHTGFDALYILVQDGNVEMTKEVLDRGANVNRVRVVKKDAHGKILEQDTPLLWAIGFGNLDLIQLLLSKGADVHSKQSAGVSAIHKAVIGYTNNRVKSRLKIVQALLDHGADINEWDEQKRTPLHIAINRSNDSSDFSMELEMLLLRRGACLSALDIRGRTPLHYAFVKINNHKDSSAIDPIQIVSALVENMTVQNLNKQDEFGASALHYAAFRGSTVCILLLLQKGACLELLDNNNETPLCYAVAGKHDGSALMIIQKDANLNVKMNKGHSLFQGILMNDWLGITYIALNKMEKFGMTYVDAIEVALHLQKLQFSKTLVSKVVDQTKLQVTGSHERNLMSIFAYEISRATMQAGIENVDDLFELLVAADVNAGHVDAWGCNPMHYALVNNNQALVNLLYKQDVLLMDVKRRTKSGRNMLAAAMWCLNDFNNLDLTNIEFLVCLKVDVNEKFCVPNFSFVLGDHNLRLTKENFVKSEDDGKVDISLTPLHLAILKEKEDVIKSLLNSGADPSIPDSNGLSPLAYAMKTNNNKVINIILDAFQDEVDMNLLEHVIALDPRVESSPSYDNSKMFQKLYNKDLNLSNEELSKLQDMAYSHGATNILKVLTKNYKRSADDENTNGVNMLDEVDYVKDSDAMLEQINKTYKAKKEDEKPAPPPSGCVVKEGTIHNGFDILMNKVDVMSGRWGKYNFYRMQIWKDAHKDLYVLFTNWGRIETWGQGQYQNTPYSKPEEAEEEFKKIFKAKAGNDWENVDNFEDKPGKYRLVKKELIKRAKREDMTFNLQTTQDFDLTLELAYLINEISDVQMIKRAFSTFGKVDFPFGRIDRESLLKAKSILVDDLLPLIKKKEKLEYSMDEPAKLQDVVQKISTLSSEYHFLVPQPGFEYERVPPIEYEHQIEEESKNLDYLLDFSYTEKLLLGAMYRRQEKHPLEYVYAGLQRTMCTVDLDGVEAKMIVNYMNKSRGAKSFKVWSIFSLQGVGDKMKTGAKKLLWHGTKRCHLISILHKGLVTQHAYSHRTGQAYGDGVYLADIFDKSISYCDGNGNRYLLLCEVDLTKCSNYDWSRSNQACTKVLGNYEPDGTKTLSTAFGYRIPAGNIVKVPPKPNTYYNHYNEYVVYDTSLIRLRYLVCIKDAKNKEEISRDKIMEAFKGNPQDDQAVNGLHDDDDQNDDDAESNSNCSDDDSEAESENGSDEEMESNQGWSGKPMKPKKPKKSGFIFG